MSGVLPLLYHRGLRRGRWLMSLPVSLQAGPLARGPEDEASLLDAGIAAAHALRAHLQIDTTSRHLSEVEPRLRRKSLPPLWVVPLPEDPEELRGAWRKGSKNLFRSLGKAEAAGIEVRQSRTADDLAGFYRLYARTMQNLRLLPRPRRQVELIHRLLEPQGRSVLLVAEHGGRTVAAGLFLIHRDTMELRYNGSERSALGLRPNHALYWAAIRWAIERGLRRFDFGFAHADSSLGRFKRQWSAERVEAFRYALAEGVQPVFRPSRLTVSDGRMAARAWRAVPPGLLARASALVYRYL